MDLYETAQLFRKELIALQSAAVERVLKAYFVAWERIAADLEKLLKKAEAAKDATGEIPISWLYEQGRLQLLLDQLAEEITRLAESAAELTTQDQERVVNLVQKRSERLIKAAPKPAGIEVVFQRLPKEQLEKFVGLTRDGSPLPESFKRLARDLGVEVSDTITNQITQGLARGDGYRKILSDLATAIEAKNGNPYKDPAIVRRLGLAVRSSINWAYSESTRETYQANRITRWEWQTSPSGACPACVALDGKIFEIDEPQGEHPNCRCVILPVIEDWDEPPRKSLFERLSEAEKIAVFGNAGYRALQDGKAQLEDFIGIRENRYGKQRGTRSLADILGPELARAYYNLSPRRR